MFRIYGRAIRCTNLTTRYLTTLPWKDYLNNSARAIQESVKFINIRGPESDELTQNLNMKNKLCLITGANSGIGLEITRCLSSCDCDVIMACRNTYDASCTAKAVCKNLDRLKYYQLNLASLKSVKEFSEKLINLEKNIDILILNAATFGLPWTLTEDKLETTFQVNFLSQYYLLLCIEKILVPDARIVFTSSQSHRNVKWPEDNMLNPTEYQLSLPEHEYTSIKAYNLSKLCGLLAMHYLRYRWLNTDRSVFCAHPGSFVKTRLCRNWWVYETLYTIMLPFSKSIKQAASTVLYCATSPELQGLTDLYFKNCKPCVESALAKDAYLSFRVHDLVCDILRDRQIDCSNIINFANREVQHPEAIEDPLISTY